MHPGATHPFGMVSACSYSGAYPTGYGRYDYSAVGLPERMYDRLQASGFTHFHQSGTGAIRKYYNYVRVTPMIGPLFDIGRSWTLVDEQASPGYYAATLDSGIRAELTVGPKSAVHRYTFPRNPDSRIVVDVSAGGLGIAGRDTTPMRIDLTTCEPSAAWGTVLVEGVPLSVYVECSDPGWKRQLWHDGVAMAETSGIHLDNQRPDTIRRCGAVWSGPSEPGRPVELRLGFSFRGVRQARANLRADAGGSRDIDTAASASSGFDVRRNETGRTWAEHLGAVTIDTASTAQRTIFSTALYRSLIKPSFAAGESPFWPGDGPFVFDLATMWDIYRTQLPLVATFFPERAVELGEALLNVYAEEGNFPIGYRLARGPDRFTGQGMALAHPLLADLCGRELGLDADRVLALMLDDLRRSPGEEYVLNGIAHPLSHSLDISVAYSCAAGIARQIGNDALAAALAALAGQWVNAYESETGLLAESEYYEGSRYNYSFRLLPDMRRRIALGGGDERFTAQLDRFFGYGAEPVTQLGVNPPLDDVFAGFDLGRFEGVNNEPDLDVPWAYHYAGRPDRTAEIVRAAVDQEFATGRGGLPGNDDSGALSSWYVWASLGLFPVAGQNRFLVNAPSVEESELRVAGGKFAVRTRGFAAPEIGGPPQYVQSITMNGSPLERSWLDGDEVHSGGELVVTLGNAPSEWGAAESARPYYYPATGA